MKSSSDHFTSFSTRPSTSKVQVARSMSGVPCASSTGHFFVRDCPGGILFSRRVSGLMMVSGSEISSGLRGFAVWYFGSLIRLSRKLIALGALCFELCALLFSVFSCCGMGPIGHMGPIRLTTTKHQVQSSFLSIPFCKRHQFFRHPLTDAFGSRLLDANVAVMPIVAITLWTTSAHIVF